MTYEAYGAGGTGFVMECLTDNLNRSASEVRAAVMRAGGKMADPGSVMFNFQRQGQVFVSPEASEDQVHICCAILCSYLAKPTVSNLTMQVASVHLVTCDTHWFHMLALHFLAWLG